MQVTSPAEQALKDGDLAAALEKLTDEVKRNPSEAALRTFLFQLLAVAGQWDRALTQLNVAGDLDAATLAMVQVYREALGCEALRVEVFEGRKTPLVFGEPEEWIALLLEALRVAAAGGVAAAAGLRARAFDAAPASPGNLDGKPFEWIADADMRLGPILEVVLNGKYYWVPFHRIAVVQFEDPEDLRDVVWTPAQFTWANGGQAVGLIPTRYVGSDRAEDPLLGLARRTEWVERETGFFVGLGQRMLATEAGEQPLMDIRRIEIQPQAHAEGTEDATGG